MSNFYKKITKNRKTREAILSFLDFVPDEPMIKIQYYIKTGRRLNLNNPKRYTEKLQWYKLYYRDPLMKECVDKYDVREYIKREGLGQILNECYGVFDDSNEIEFNKLPNSFVLKDTLGGGGNSVLLIKDKSQMDIKRIKSILKEWVSSNTKKSSGREWVYDEKKHRIIIDKFIESDSKKGGLIDYKFFCFNGRAEYVYGIADRSLGFGAGLGIYDKNFNLLRYRRVDEKQLKRNIPRPPNFNKMREIAERISKPFPHARVDMYNIDGRIIFGEITFFDGSGYMCFEPDEFDYILGECFTLPKAIKEN